MKRLVLVCTLAASGILGAWWLMRAGELTRGENEANPAVRQISEFRLPDLDGRERSIYEWSGRPLIINFWATWCAPCRREMPLLQSVQDEQSEDGLQIIGIALDTREDAQRFVTEKGVRYPILYGEHEAALIAESFGDDFVALPFSVFVAADGTIVALKSGELQAIELRSLIAQLGGAH